MEILWHSNAPWATTGYGNQTALVAPRLKEAGHAVAVSAFYGLQGAAIPWKGIPVLPGNNGTFGNEVLQGHAVNLFGQLRDGLVVTLMDVWVLDPKVIGAMNVASWVPVDHDPAPPAVVSFFEESGSIPIAMSRFGEERLERFDPLYCPHAVDTEVFGPQEGARKLAGVPDSAFVVGMVAANQGNSPSRKAFPQALAAFKALRERHSDAILCLHTNVSASSGGVNLPKLIDQLGIPEDALRISPQYRYHYLPLSGKDLAAMYSSFDVLLNPSMGEGFGIPILEAQACGTPVVVTDFSAMSEVCGAGWKVQYNPAYTGQESYMADPIVEDILESLEQAYRMPAAQRRKLSERAREHALGYDIETVMTDHMLPVIEECAERFGLTEKVKVAA